MRKTKVNMSMSDDVEDLKSQIGTDAFNLIEQQLVDKLSKSIVDDINEGILFNITGMNKTEREINNNRNNKIEELFNDGE